MHVCMYACTHTYTHTQLTPTHPLPPTQLTSHVVKQVLAALQALFFFFFLTRTSSSGSGRESSS